MIIEITETAAIVDVTETRRFVDVLRALGGRVSLDDFGAGFTSIRHLRSLSLSIMKIDKELLHNVIDNSEQQHLVRMLIELARGLGLQTVAEGVETADVADWLRSEKVDMMQGYYFGKPSLERSWATDKASDAPAPGPAHPISANRKSNVVVLPPIISPLSSSSAATMVPVAHDLAMEAIVFRLTRPVTNFPHKIATTIKNRPVSNRQKIRMVVGADAASYSSALPAARWIPTA